MLMLYVHMEVCLWVYLDRDVSEWLSYTFSDHTGRDPRSFTHPVVVVEVLPNFLPGQTRVLIGRGVITKTYPV